MHVMQKQKSKHKFLPRSQVSRQHGVGEAATAQHLLLVQGVHLVRVGLSLVLVLGVHDLPGRPTTRVLQLGVGLRLHTVDSLGEILQLQIRRGIRIGKSFCAIELGLVIQVLGNLRINVPVPVVVTRIVTLVIVHRGLRERLRCILRTGLRAQGTGILAAPIGVHSSVPLFVTFLLLEGRNHACQLMMETRKIGTEQCFFFLQKSFRILDDICDGEPFVVDTTTVASAMKPGWISERKMFHSSQSAETLHHINPNAQTGITAWKQKQNMTTDAALFFCSSQTH